MSKERYQKLILPTILAISIIAIGFYFFKNLSFSDTYWNFSVDKTKFSLFHGNKLKQKFTSNKNGLSGMEIRLPGKKYEETQTFYLDMMNEDCSKTLRKSKISFEKIDSDDPLRFSFERIEDSENRDFCFFVYSDFREASIYLSKEPVPQTFLENVGGEKILARYSLLMRPVYKEKSVIKNLEMLSKRISQYKPFFLKHYFLWIIAVLFLILSVFLSFYLII